MVGASEICDFCIRTKTCQVDLYHRKRYSYAIYYVLQKVSVFVVKLCHSEIALDALSFDVGKCKKQVALII